MSHNNIVLRRSDRLRTDGVVYKSEWVEITNILAVVAHGAGNYTYLVDGVMYNSRSGKWRKKLAELQTWRKLQNV